MLKFTRGVRQNETKSGNYIYRWNYFYDRPDFDS